MVFAFVVCELLQCWMSVLVSFVGFGIAFCCFLLFYRLLFCWFWCLGELVVGFVGYCDVAFSFVCLFGVLCFLWVLLGFGGLHSLMLLVV